mgnify:CR=1 FL=1
MNSLLRGTVIGALVLLIAAAMAGIAYAAEPGVPNTVTAATITGTSGNCLVTSNARSSLTLDASASATNIGYCEGPACTAAIGTTGTTTIVAGDLHYWPAGSAPRGEFCFIAVSGSQPFTIREGK